MDILIVDTDGSRLIMSDRGQSINKYDTLPINAYGGRKEKVSLCITTKREN